MKNKVITRFPPSPTGPFHVGSARTALFNFLFAKQNDGKMILRSEDTDKERSDVKFEEDIKAGLDWLGIEYSDFYRQSERTDIYKKYLKDLIDSGNAYLSKEESGKSAEVIRFKNPNQTIVFNDLIRGEISFDTTELGDFVIAKDLDNPLYHLAVVVDDHEMGVTHIIRGEDGISNTPRQILIQRAIKATEPVYAHIPLVLDKDRKKLSKRNAVTALSDYRGRGYLPSAVNNFLALLGWHPENEKEIFSLDELIKEFSIERIQKGGAIFDQEKLDWINKEHIKRMPEEDVFAELKERLSDRPEIVRNREILFPAILERISVFSEADKMFAPNGEFYFIYERPKLSSDILVGSKNKDLEEAQKHLSKIEEILSKVQEEDFRPESIKDAVWDYASEEGRGEVLWPMRVSLTGQKNSPDPFISAALLGKEETLRRLEDAQKI